MGSVVAYQTDNGAEVKLSPEIIRKYLVNGAKVTDQEVIMFIQLCRYQKINPFLREAYLIKYGNSPAQMVTGKELFTKRAEAHKDFRGYEAGIIVLNKDEVIEERKGTTIVKALGEKLIGGWAKVYKDGRQVAYENTAMFEEYAQNTAIWRDKPATMIRKVALVQALREAFPDIFGGLYSQEEMPIKGEELPVEEKKIISKAQRERMFAKADGNEELVRKIIEVKGYTSTKDILVADYDEICGDIDECALCGTTEEISDKPKASDYYEEIEKYIITPNNLTPFEPEEL